MLKTKWIYHIFAVDGLRIAIISGILIAFFRALAIPRAVCGMLTVPVILFYAALTGWPASAVRAIVMAFVIFGGWALKRPSDPLNSLFAAAIIILTWEPRQLFESGFQLSFVVVLCIILILPLFDRFGQLLLQTDPLLPEQLRPRWQKLLHPVARAVVGLFLVSLAAWLGSIPLAAYYFHLFTPSSGPANIFAVPLCGLVLICNCSSLLLAGWLPPVAVLFNHAGWFLMKLIILSSQWSAHWRGAYRYVPMPGLFTIALYYWLLLGMLTGWLFRAPWRQWKLGATILLCAAWCGQELWLVPETHLTVLPLEAGHAVYVQPPGWKSDVLVDCGDEFMVDATLKPYLRSQGVNRLSQLILTHGENSFSGGAALLDELFHPSSVASSAVHFRSSEFRAFQSMLRAKGVNQPVLGVGDGYGPFTVLYPGPNVMLGRAADEAIVLRADIGSTRVLLLSDLGHLGQNELLNDLFLADRTNDLRADIVIAGVPEKSEPLSDPLLNAVQPKLVIIEDSEYPAQRRATSNLQQRLARHGVPVIYASKSGAVAFTFRAGSWQAQAMDETRYAGEGRFPRP